MPILEKYGFILPDAHEQMTREDAQMMLEGLFDAKGEVRPADLTAQEKIVRGRLPGLELIFDHFVRTFRGTLGTMLNRHCNLTLVSVTSDKFGVFMKKLSPPASIHLFRMSPLSGQAFIVVSSSLVFATIDSMFGGRGRPARKADAREFTPLENRLISRVMLLALENLQECWAAITPMEFIYVRAEQNPSAVTIAAPGDSVVVVSLEIEIGSDRGPCAVCFPTALLSPIQEKLGSGFQGMRAQASEATAKKMAVAIKDTEVELRVVLAQGSLKMRDVFSLKIGDVIPLATDAEAKAVVEVEGKPKYQGEVGVHHGRAAVKITGRASRK